MKIDKIIGSVNKLLADELYPYSYLEQFLDETIDDINERLSACFPTFSEFMAGYDLEDDPDYDLFPDNYIRKVVIKGAAYKFYVTDEEGIDTAQRYGADYMEALFKMQRDYSTEVPDEYSVDHLAALDTHLESSQVESIDLTVQGWGW